LNFYINRAGKNLTQERHAELEKAKTILSEIIAKEKSESEKPAKKTAKKAVKKTPKKTSAKSSSKKSIKKK
jgi:topoisomerase IA-like protein